MDLFIRGREEEDARDWAWVDSWTREEKDERVKGLSSGEGLGVVKLTRSVSLFVAYYADSKLLDVAVADDADAEL